MSRPLGYFLSWGTYGTRLHGDPRGTVDRTNTTRGDPVLGPDEERWEHERGQMKFPPVVLMREQRLFAEELIPTICERGLWTYHTCAVAPDHVHVVLTSEHEPRTIRRILKRWLGQSMSERWPLAEGRRGGRNVGVSSGSSMPPTSKMPRATFRASARGNRVVVLRQNDRWDIAIL